MRENPANVTPLLLYQPRPCITSPCIRLIRGAASIGRERSMDTKMSFLRGEGGCYLGGYAATQLGICICCPTRPASVRPEPATSLPRQRDIRAHESSCSWVQLSMQIQIHITSPIGGRHTTATRCIHRIGYERRGACFSCIMPAVISALFPIRACISSTVSSTALLVASLNVEPGR